nr:putative ankyrin repeat protein RF_0381 [Parasteatoda tepidariorum]
MTDESKHVVDEGTLSKLINKETIEIGERLSDLGDIENYYINRIFTQSTIKKDIKNEYKMHITYNDRIQKSSLNGDQDIVLISDERGGFDELCNAYKNRNIHWLKEVESQFVWQKSRGGLSRLRDYIDTKSVSKFRDIGGRIVIISAVSGAGKSTVLTKLAQEMKNFDSSMWIVRINLNDYTEIFANNDFIRDKDKIIKFIMDIAGLKTPLEQDLFNYRLNVLGKVAILFDGFDEIVPRYKEKVVELLKALKHSKVEKIWITTRPHMKDELEDVLSVLSYSLMPLSRNDQVMFMKNILCNIPEFSIKENFERYANKLLDKVQWIISDKNKEFTGIPLQTKMLVEAYQEKFKTINDLFNKNESNISIKLDLMNLYRAFVVSKYKRHLLEKKILDLTKSGPEYDLLLESIMEKYSLLALCTIFHVKDLNLFLVEEELDKIKLFKKQIQEGKENSGFISHIVAAKPIFIHFSFAEYFAALFYSKNIKRKKVTKFFCDYVYGKEYNLTSIFFDQMVTIDEHTCKIYTLHIAVLNNDVEKVKQLLSNAEKAKHFINAADKVGRTALHLAAAYGHFYLVRTLLNHEFRVDAEDQLLGWRPLRYADKDGHWETVELLLRKGANACDMYEAIKSIETYDAEKPKKTLLHEAAKKNLVQILETLIKNKIKLIEAVDENGCTPLHYAAGEEVAKLLIKRGAYIEATSMYGETPLHHAVKHDEDKVVERLIKKGADVEAKGYHDETPLFSAESKKVYEFLIAKGANINAKNSLGYTPLHSALMNRKDEIVELLINKGADVEAKDYDDETPLFSAGSKKAFELLIAKGADINAKSSEGYTPLHSALMNGKDEVVELLINKGADVEAKSYNDITPLFSASSKKAFELLIAKGADINAKSCEGYTPLHRALMNREDEVVELLINKGADVEAKGYNDKTPLFLAGSKKAFELLIAKGADINAKSSEGYTPLHSALMNRKDEVVELLINKGVDVEAKGYNDRTPLFSAGSKKAFELLIAKGADINAKSSEGYTPLHSALMNRKDEVVELLIKKGAKIEAKDYFGRTPLFYARNTRVCESLIANGADVNVISNGGYTPVDCAVINKRHEVAKLLAKQCSHMRLQNS